MALRAYLHVLAHVEDSGAGSWIVTPECSEVTASGKGQHRATVGTRESSLVPPGIDRTGAPSEPDGDDRTQPSPTKLLSVAYCEKRFGLAYIVHGVNQLAPQQVKRRPIVEQEVMKRIGQDFRHPDQAGPDVADEEQLHGAE
jgi:hypothetical protein